MACRSCLSSRCVPALDLSEAPEPPALAGSLLRGLIATADSSAKSAERAFNKPDTQLSFAGAPAPPAPAGRSPRPSRPAGDRSACRTAAARSPSRCSAAVIVAAAEQRALQFRQRREHVLAVPARLAVLRRSRCPPPARPASSRARSRPAPPRRRPGLAAAVVGRHEEARLRRRPARHPRCRRPADAFDPRHAPGSFCSRCIRRPGKSCRVSVPPVSAVHAGFASGTGLAAFTAARLAAYSFRTCYRRGLPWSGSFACSLWPSSLAAALPADGAGAHQGHRRRRGRPREPAGRLRPGGRPERHRRQAGQRRCSPGRSLIGMLERLGRQHPRPGAEARHQEHRRGDGHRRASRPSPAAAAGSTSRSPRWATPPT